MTRLPVACLVSGNGGLLARTLAAQSAPGLRFGIVHVIADRACGALDVAAAHGVPATLVDHATAGGKAAFQQGLLDAIRRTTAQALMLNFDRLLGPDLVAAFPDRIVNIHFSLLPAFPGFGAIPAALAAGVRIGGVTTHLVGHGVDDGPVIGQAGVPTRPDDDAARFGRRLFEAGVALQLQTLQFLGEGRLRVVNGRVAIDGARWDALPFNPALEPAVAAALALAGDAAGATPGRAG